MSSRYTIRRRTKICGCSDFYGVFTIYCWSHKIVNGVMHHKDVVEVDNTW